MDQYYSPVILSAHVKNVSTSIDNQEYYFLVYSSFFLFTVLAGIAVNIVVIAAYIIGYKKKLSKYNLSVGFKNKLNSIPAIPANNFNMNCNSSRPNRLVSTNKIDRRISLAVPSVYTNSKAGCSRIENRFTFEEEKPTRYSQTLYRRRKSSIVEISRNYCGRSSNSLTLFPYEQQSANKIRHTLCSYFILTLSCCDLLICMLVMPANLIIESGYFHQYLSQLTQVDNLEGDLCCRISFYLVQIPLVLEIEVLLTIAIDRYSSVFNPIKIYFFDRTKSKLTLMAQILLSCVLSLPNLIIYNASKTSITSINEIDSNSTSESHIQLRSFSSYCVIREKFRDFYVIYQLVLFSLFSFSLLVISVFYIKVYRHIYKVSCHQRFENLGRRNAISISKNNIEISRLKSRRPGFMNAIRKMCTKEKQKVDFATLSALQNAECELPASNLKNIEEIDAEDVNTEDISQINCNKNENFLAERSIRADADSHLLIEISNKSLSQNKLSEKSIKSDSQETQEKISNQFESKDDHIKLFKDSCLLKPYSGRRGSCPTICLNTPTKLANSLSVTLENSNSSLNIKRKNSFQKNFQVRPVFEQKKKDLSKQVSPKPNKKTSKQDTLSVRPAPKSPAFRNRFRRFSDLNPSFKKNIFGSSAFGDLNSNYSRSINSNSNHPNTFRRHTQKVLKHGKTARILGVATLAFAITWAPYWYYIIKHSIFSQRHVYSDSNSFTSASEFLLTKIIKNSFYLNYVLNPLFYSFVNRRFRQNVCVIFQLLLKFLLKYCCCCCFKKLPAISTFDEPTNKSHIRSSFRLFLGPSSRNSNNNVCVTSLINAYSRCTKSERIQTKHI